MNNMNNAWKMNIRLNIFIILALAIFIFSIIDVHALGVAPSRKIVDYSLGEQSYDIRLINNENKDMRVMIYFQGELSEYASIDKNIITVNSDESEKTVRYKINVPAGLSPGTKKLDVMMLELGENIDTDKLELDKTIIFSTALIVHQLRVNVPYPGVFAEGVLYISEANVNDTLTFTVNVLNKGTQEIKNINGELVIKGPTNEEIKRIQSGTIASIDAGQAEKLTINTMADMNPGLYAAEFIVHYNDKQFVLRKTFTVDTLSADVRTLTIEDFRLGYISKVNIDVLNRWNLPIYDAYAYLQVIDEKGNLISETKTSSTTLTQLTTTTLSGYWDTKGLNIGKYDMKVILHYNDKVSEKIFDAVIGVDNVQIIPIGGNGLVVGLGDERSSGNMLLYIIVSILVVVNVFLLFVYFKYIKKKK